MHRYRIWIAAILLTILCGALVSAADELKILLPQNRTAFQTNEWIDISVVRKAAQPLDAVGLNLVLTGLEDQSKISAVFAWPSSAATATTEHYHINGRLLRPGKYSVNASANGATAEAQIEVYSHLRKSDFRLVNWGRATKELQLVEGEDSLGFNLFYGSYGRDTDANFIRAGVDYISCCTMGGAHQMDIRLECDWSDPYVIRGGTSRVVREALMDRTRPNVLGVHFYDEPGLTWEKLPDGLMTPHSVAAQHRAFEAAFGEPALSSKNIDLKNPESVRKWEFWAHWKLGFMDAAWREAQFGVSSVRPDYVSLTQSQYAGTAFTDGYYFNVVRDLPITSGHGGYHDWGPGYFNPSYTLELARARDFAKPDWYLPCWYGNTTPDQFRLEQYLSFMTNLQGMISPPDIEPAQNALPRQGVVESNQTMLRLGPIFNQMPVTKPPVAILYSLSAAIHWQMEDPANNNYSHSMRHGMGLPHVYLAGKLIQHQFVFVLDEDVLDGTLANDHKAVILTSIDYLDPKVVAGLEAYASSGGLVLLTTDSKVVIKGGTKLSAQPGMPDQEKINELGKAKKYKEMEQYVTMPKWVQGATPLAKAINAELDKAGIKPVFECDTSGIAASRQASGDVEYFFAVNASCDETAKENLALKAVTAQISLPPGSAFIYDAIGGGAVSEFQKKDDKLTGSFRFGPGQMRVFARTARALHGPVISTPVVERVMTAEQAPIKVTCNITVVDEAKAPLSGAIPLHIIVVDALGQQRYEFYRATRNGTMALEFPLGVNDPPGQWAIIASDLLVRKNAASVPFDYQPPKRFAAIAGATPRAVYASNDRENVFRFARTHHAVTIVKGKSAFNAAAAERLIKTLKPWGVTCVSMDLADASKPRSISEDEARTWCGLEPGVVKPGAGNSPKQVGFAVQGPVIVLGNPEDNSIINFLKEERFLPYVPATGTFPGTSRGMVAWQRDGVGRAQESIALIGYDEAGMSEAAGSLYEAIAGIDPLTRWILPETHTIVPASKGPAHHPVNSSLTLRLPDRVDALKIDGDKLLAYTHDGSECSIDSAGKTFTPKLLAREEYDEAVKAATTPAPLELNDAMKANTRPERMLKLAIFVGDNKAFAYWGGDLRVVGKDGAVISQLHCPNDITALAYFQTAIVVGLADGRLMLLK